MALAPFSRATDISTAVPRSLKEPVGFLPSTLRNNSTPILRPSLRLLISGVALSRKVINSACCVIGNNGKYLSRLGGDWRK